MGYFIGEEFNTKEGFVFIYSGISQQEMELLVDSTMISLGYKPQKDGIYEYGSRTMRLLLGGFYRYFKFRVIIDSSNPSAIKVALHKRSTGMSGGLLGMKRMNSEMKRLKEIFSQL